MGHSVMAVHVGNAPGTHKNIQGFHPSREMHAQEQRELLPVTIPGCILVPVSVGGMCLDLTTSSMQKDLLLVLPDAVVSAWSQGTGRSFL